MNTDHPYLRSGGVFIHFEPNPVPGDLNAKIEFLPEPQVSLEFDVAQQFDTVQCAHMAATAKKFDSDIQGSIDNKNDSAKEFLKATTICIGMNGRAGVFAAIRACLQIGRRAAARDFGCGPGGEVGASPQRTVTTEPTPPTAKRPAALRVARPYLFGFVPPSSQSHSGVFSHVVPRYPAGSAKQHFLRIFSQALNPSWCS
jgi:hypothetical protein